MYVLVPYGCQWFLECCCKWFVVCLYCYLSYLYITSESVCNQTSLPGFPFQFVHNACVCQLVPLKHKLLGLGLVIPLLQVLLVRHLLIVWLYGLFTLKYFRTGALVMSFFSVLKLSSCFWLQNYATSFRRIWCSGSVWFDGLGMNLARYVMGPDTPHTE